MLFSPRVSFGIVEDNELVVVRVAVELGHDGVLEPIFESVVLQYFNLKIILRTSLKIIGTRVIFYYSSKIQQQSLKLLVHYFIYKIFKNALTNFLFLVYSLSYFLLFSRQPLTSWAGP